MKAEDRKAEWEQFRRKASSGFTGLPNRLIDSPAFAEIGSAASVRTLVWFWQNAKYEKNEKRGRNKKRPVGMFSIGRIDKITNNGNISFTYQVAEWRGMNARRFSRALKELFRLGFIDVKHHGRGVKGDYTQFAISDRWKEYGTPEWQETTFPENFREGFREQKKGKHNGHERPLLTDTNICYSEDGMRNNRRERPLKPAILPKLKRTRTSVSKDICHGYTAIPEGSRFGGNKVSDAILPPVGGWVEEYDGMVHGHISNDEGGETFH